MWWMWHGKTGHWVINATPGNHGDDQAKTVGFFDHKCATEFVPWNIGNNGDDFTIQCVPRKFLLSCSLLHKSRLAFLRLYQLR